MDHLQYPRHSTCPIPRVRYVAQHYDQGSFTEFQERHSLLHSASVAEFESFVQTWLYYGLLHEVLGSEWDPQTYVSSDDRGQIVCSRSLYEDLGSWVTRTQAWAKEYRHDTLTHLAVCLERASAFALYSRPFDRSIRQSIAALGEAISEAVVLAADEDLDVGLPSIWASLYYDGEVRQHMRQHGWCPSDILRSFRSFRTVDAIYWMERLSKQDSTCTHDRCTDEVCHHAQIDPVTYQPRHIGACDCDTVGPPMADVMRCLTGGTYPVLRIAGDSLADIDIEVVPYKDRTPYVALSHVWSDGLGNPRASQLPRCRILDLKEKIDRLQQDDFVGRHGASTSAVRNLAIWCDTLCCPVEPQSKALALKMMREVYRNATHVLVLDGSVSRYELEQTGIREACVRLSTSTWTSRLWTLQECALAGSLLIQFADAAVDLKYLLSALYLSSRSDLSMHGLDNDIAAALLTLTGFKLLIPTPGQGALFAAVEAIRFRRASIASDEPLCLSTLLSLDVRNLTDVSPADRMPMFWNMVSRTDGGIPQGIIFNEYRRLKSVGFRWAPASLVGFEASQGASISSTEMEYVPQLQGKLVSRGLEVSYPAIGFHLPNPLTRHGLNLERIFGTYKHKVQLRHHDGHWYEISYLGHDADLVASELWRCCAEWQSSILILGHIPEEDEGIASVDALLAGLSHQTSAINMLHSHLKVAIRRITHHENALWEVAKRPSHVLRQEMRDYMRQDGITGEALSEKLVTRSRELAEDTVQHLGGPIAEHRYIPRLSISAEDPLSRMATVIAVLTTGQYLAMTRAYTTDSKWLID